VTTEKGRQFFVEKNRVTSVAAAGDTNPSVVTAWRHYRGYFRAVCHGLAAAGPCHSCIADTALAAGGR